MAKNNNWSNRENKICKFDNNKTYFSICPDWNGNPEYSWETKGNMSFVYLNKEKALAKLKKHKNARLRSFTNIDEALEFTYEGNLTDSSNYSRHSQNNDCNDTAKAGRIRFRKIIESGQINLVEYIVAKSPKCLVASCDSPAILIKEGRYNALHIACKSLYTDICLFILQTISDLEFYKRLYPDNSSTYYSNLREVLLDSYINTPTIGTYETPLHYAAKNGCYEVVKTLVSFPELKMTRNKWNQLPIEVICSNRQQTDFELISKIMILLQKNYFVPVLRSADRCTQPIIGTPFLSHNLPSLRKDKFDPIMEIHAIAGPMSESDAFKFYETWNSPNNRGVCNLTVYGKFTTPQNMDFPQDIYSQGHLQAELYRSLRCSDYEKGLEVIGRSLTRTLKIGWMEYWSFLGAFSNLAEPNGLRMFEGYLREKIYEKSYIGKGLRTKQLILSATRDGIRVTNRRGNTRHNSTFTKVEDIEQMLNLRNSNGKFVPSTFLNNYVNFFSRKLYDTLVKFGAGNNVILLKNFKKQADRLNSAMECFEQFFDGGQFNLQLIHPEIGKEVASLIREESVRCDIKTRLFKTITTNNLSFIIPCKNVRQIHVMPYMKCVIKNTLRNLMLMSYSDNSQPRVPLFEGICRCRWSETKHERKAIKLSKHTHYPQVLAGNSKQGPSKVVDDGMYFVQEDDEDNIFIYDDNKPNKMDYYVLMVLQDIEICSNTYPLVYKWRNSVISYKMSR